MTAGNFLSRPVDSPLFSIIVPIYNTAGYLDACLRSLLDQTCSDLELIAVDDGSTDGSAEILSRVAKTDARIRIFRKANGGQGSARNYGLEKARGRYVLFVDSDDTLSPDTLKKVVPYLNDPIVDVVSFGIAFIREDGKVLAARTSVDVAKVLGRQNLLDAMLDRRFLTTACNKAYRRARLVECHLKFPALRAFEDSVFSRLVAKHARSVVYLPEVLYSASIRTGSTSRNMSGKSFAVAAEMIEIERDLFYSKSCDTPVRVAFRAHVARFFSYLLIQAAFRIDDADERLACYQIAKDSGFVSCATDPTALKMLNLRQRLMIFIARRRRIARLIAVLLRSFRISPY